MTRLSDEAALIDLAEKILVYYKRVGDQQPAAAVTLMIVEHLYYKHDSHAAAVHKAHLFNSKWGQYQDLHPASLGKIVATTENDATKTHPASYLGNPTVAASVYSAEKKMDDFCNFIFKYGDERNKTRALLCGVYHHALHDRYYQARDMFLISHIQDFIEKAEVKTQILYNRAVVTLGLSAFRMGLFQKAHDCLSNICTGRVRELLAQGQMKWAEKDPEQEKLERRRQMPYHMHINPDLLECCHLTCAMILELPQLARHSIFQQNIISRHFRKHLHGYSKQVNTRYTRYTICTLYTRYTQYTLYTPYTLNILYTHYTLYSMNLLKPIFSLENKIQAALLGGIGGVDVKDVTDELANLKNEPCVIYTYGLSPFSTEAISVLEAAGAKFEKRELGLEWFLLGPQASVMRLELENLTGQSSLPHVFIGGESIGGLSTGTPGLAALVESGELATKLKKAKAL